LLLDALDGYEVYTVRRYLEERPMKGFIILRHDVDRMPGNALRMSKLENEFEIKSTYYFRYTDGAFWRKIIKALSDSEHEVGYHYETLSKTKGDHGAAMQLFRFELEEFRKICDVKTVSMHGKPLSRHVNNEIWETSSFAEYSLIGDASLSISGIPYFSDAGRSWDNRNNIRDYLKTADLAGHEVRCTDELIRLLSTQSYPSVYLNIHPERWVGNASEWCLSYLVDLCFNIGKRLVNSIRGRD
jgi:hypothetical protein